MRVTAVGSDGCCGLLGGRHSKCGEAVEEGTWREKKEEARGVR